MQTIGDESIIAVEIPVTRLVAPGPLVAIATPTLPRRPRIAIRHVRRALLVAHQHVMNLRILGHRIVGRQDRPAGIAENHVHAFTEKAFHHNFSAAQQHGVSAPPNLRVQSAARASASRVCLAFCPDVIAKNSSCTALVIGPRDPLPICIRSTERIGVTSAAVPVKKISSAM